jgi:hypothetical protein
MKAMLRFLGIPLVAAFCFALMGATASGQRVQTMTATGSSQSPSATFTSDPTSGNLLIAIVGCGTHTISQPSGWSTAINQTGTVSQAIFYKTSAGSSDKIVTFTNALSESAGWGFQIFEYSNIAGSPLDVTASNTGSGTSITTGTTGTTAQAKELIIVGVNHGTATSFDTWTNSFGEINDFTLTGGTCASAERIVSSIGTYSSGATAAASSDWLAQIVAFKGTSSLPIQMASFAANVVRDNQVEVAWKTVSETNNYGFEIYRKRGDAGEWAKVSFVQGHGTTLTPQSYSYVDAGLSFGKYTYRIKQVDLDGKSETFPEMSVTVGVGPDKFVLAQNYPNPFNPSTLIEFVAPQSGFATLKVYNVLGQEVATVFEGNAEAGKINTARFNALSLPSGVYFYTLRSAGKVQTKRMLLTK